ncbi:MAG: sodium:calcium antiporter [Methylococcaceae bacterium]
MLIMFLVWLLAAIIEARKQRNAAEEVLGEHRAWLVVILCIAGLAFLAAAGNLIVTGARGIAISCGIDEFIIGATIVAVGTSVPELATTIIAKLRGHDEVGLGTILGSNIFNGLLITSVAAIIHPITVAWNEIAITLAIGLLALVFTYPTRKGYIQRSRGALLLTLYVVYLAAILQSQST